MKMKRNGIGFDFCVFTDYDSSADVHLYEIGNYSCEPGYSYGPIIRSRGIMHYVMSGKGILKMEKKVYEIHGGQIFYIPAGISAYYAADQDTPWSYRWLHIGGTELHSVLRDIGLDENNPVLDVTSKSDTNSTFETLINDIFENYERQYYCIGKVYEIMDYLKKEHGHSDSETSDNLQLQYVRTVIKYIQLKFSEQIHMDDIAHTCGLNRSYLTRLFHEATGYTVKGYLLSYRMKAAQKMLKESDYPIQYIGSAVGYTDIFTFSKAFKKYSGLTPSEYRSKT